MIERAAELQRALELLDGREPGPTTVAAMRAGGVEAPGHAVYMLQLAGYSIDRVRCTDPDGKGTVGYRLFGAPAIVL
jgi:hypothetical protein